MKYAEPSSFKSSLLSSNLTPESDAQRVLSFSQPPLHLSAAIISPRNNFLRASIFRAHSDLCGNLSERFTSSQRHAEQTSGFVQYGIDRESLFLNSQLIQIKDKRLLQASFNVEKSRRRTSCPSTDFATSPVIPIIITSSIPF